MVHSSVFLEGVCLGHAAVSKIRVPAGGSQICFSISGGFVDEVCGSG